MKLKINLATRRYIDRRLVNGVLAGLFVVVFALLAYQVNRVAFLAGELKRVKGESVLLTRGAKAEVVNEQEYRNLKGHIALANQILQRKGVSWLPLLDALEETVPDGVALNRIEPESHSSTIKVSAAARNFGNIRVFLENLERSPRFSEVYLLNQSETKVGLTQQGILFSVSLRMNTR